MSEVASGEEEPKGNLRGWFWGYESALAMADQMPAIVYYVEEVGADEVIVEACEFECLLRGRNPVCLWAQVDDAESLDIEELVSALDNAKGRYRLELLDKDGRVIDAREGNGG